MAKKTKKQGKLKASNLVLFILTAVFIILVIALFNQSLTGRQSLIPATPGLKTENSTQPVKSGLEMAPKNTKVLAVGVPQSSGYQLKVPILLYHYIGNNPNPQDTQRNVLSVSPDQFDKQMKYLQDNGYSTSTLDTLYAALKKQATLPPKSVILTFDDGYVDFYVNAYPILKKYNFHATVFIPTGMMNQGFYLGWFQIKEMHSSGLIHFGSHSVHHSHLPSLSSDVALIELSQSKTVLQDMLGVPINFMAYPYGATNFEVTELVKKTGYVGAVGTWGSNIQSEDTIYNMPRFKVGGGVDLKYFAALL